MSQNRPTIIGFVWVSKSTIMSELLLTSPFLSVDLSKQHRIEQYEYGIILISVLVGEFIVVFVVPST